jgi:hypothetical protein
MALLPESVADRYTAPGIRFLPLEGPQLLCETAVVTRPGVDHRPTAAFLHALDRARRLRIVPGATRSLAPAAVAA